MTRGRWELAVDKATAVAELEALDLPGAAPGGSSRAASAHKAVDAQKERAHAALLAAASTDRERLAAIEAEMSTDLVSKLTSAEKIQLSGLHDTLKELTRTRDAADSDLAKAEGAAASLRDQLDEHLRKRQEELQQAIEGMDVEEVRDGGAGGGEAGSKQQQLDEASTSLGAIEESLATAAKEKENKRDLERSLQAATEALRARMATERAQQAEEAKQVDRLLSRRGLLLGKVDEFSACIRKLGMIPKDALDGVMSSLSSKVRHLPASHPSTTFSDLPRVMSSLSSTVLTSPPSPSYFPWLPPHQPSLSLSSQVLLAEIDKCAAEVAKLGYVNKKALDQCVSFAEERDRLLAKQEEMDAARESIEELIEHLDHKKDEAIERTFKGVSMQVRDSPYLLMYLPLPRPSLIFSPSRVSMQFVKVFLELVPGGEGSLVMTQHAKLPPGSDAAARLANYAGVAIKVRFPGSGVATSMAQLSGGQKTMVALCLIFAIQRCDPAPFYIFDEIDAALDATHRSALASMIEGKACAYTDEEGNELLATQFVTTTFRPELIDAATKCFGVTHARKVSACAAPNSKPLPRCRCCAHSSCLRTRLWHRRRRSRPLSPPRRSASLPRTRTDSVNTLGSRSE